VCCDVVAGILCISITALPYFVNITWFLAVGVSIGAQVDEFATWCERRPQSQTLVVGFT
jgi:hypothetical protein